MLAVIGGNDPVGSGSEAMGRTAADRAKRDMFVRLAEHFQGARRRIGNGNRQALETRRRLLGLQDARTVHERV
jgi:hypothetical protein